MKSVVDGDTNCSWCTWNGHQRIGKRIETVENRRKILVHSDYSIAEIDQHTEKSPADVKRLAAVRFVENPIS